MPKTVSHSTAICPWCGKDSYSSEFEAWFGTAECTWCGCKFKKQKTYIIVKEGSGEKQN